MTYEEAAYQRGWQMFFLGATKSNNPFPTGFKNGHESWINGWEAAFIESESVMRFTNEPTA